MTTQIVTKMNKKDAKLIAETITNYQLAQMFIDAKEGIKDWTVVSSVNKGISKGVAWNVLARDFDITYKHHILAKRNMIREFGEFLPSELKPVKPPKKKVGTHVHHDPIFEPRKVQGVYDLWDWVVDIDDNVIRIVQDDQMGLPYEKISRHATRQEIKDNE